MNTEHTPHESSVDGGENRDLKAREIAQWTEWVLCMQEVWELFLRMSPHPWSNPQELNGNSPKALLGVITNPLNKESEKYLKLGYYWPI